MDEKLTREQLMLEIERELRKLSRYNKEVDAYKRLNCLFIYSKRTYPDFELKEYRRRLIEAMQEIELIHQLEVEEKRLEQETQKNRDFWKDNPKYQVDDEDDDFLPGDEWKQQ